MRRFLLWVVMVIVMVAVLLGGTAGVLYTMVGEDDLPQGHVSFGEVTLEPNGWEWQVPVLGGVVEKTYQSPTNLTVQKLGTFTDTLPELVLPAWVTRAQITVKQPDGTTWQGTETDWPNFTYTANGAYELTVVATAASTQKPAKPQGFYAYRAGYTVQFNPKVRLSSDRVAQGGIVAVELSGILDGEPALESDLGTVWFRKTTAGYMGYLPVTYNAESGVHTMVLTCGSLEQEIELTVLQGSFPTVAEEPEESFAGAEAFRNAIWPLYTVGSSEKLWNGRFVDPCSSGMSKVYGSIQMVDGTRNGQATGITYAAKPGDTILAPQAGTVMYAGVLQYSGGTVVIDHGCGVKSYLYGMDNVLVERGQTVEPGTEVGTYLGGHGLIYEMRIGNKSVDPQQAISGRSGLQYQEGT